MKIEKKDDIRPRCPFCERHVDTLAKIRHGSIEQHSIYCCPHCHKILGVGVARS